MLFTCTNSFNPHDNPVLQTPLLFCFTDGVTETQWVHNLLKVTPLESGQDEMQAPESYLGFHTFKYYSELLPPLLFASV